MILDDFKKKHNDWQERARKALGLTAPTVRQRNPKGN